MVCWCLKSLCLLRTSLCWVLCILAWFWDPVLLEWRLGMSFAQAFGKLGSLSLSLSFHNCLHWFQPVVVVIYTLQWWFFFNFLGHEEQKYKTGTILWQDRPIDTKPGHCYYSVQPLILASLLPNQLVTLRIWKLGLSWPPLLRQQGADTKRITRGCASPRISPSSVPSLCHV